MPKTYFTSIHRHHETAFDVRGLETEEKAPDIYSVRRFEKVQNMHFGVSKSLKACFVVYLSLKTTLHKARNPTPERKPVLQIISGFLRSQFLLTSFPGQKEHLFWKLCFVSKWSDQVGMSCFKIFGSA